MARARTSRGGLLANLAVAGAATLVALAILEGALRLFNIDAASFHAIAAFTVYDPELGWRLAPSRNVVFKGGRYAARVEQNAQGLRDRSYAYERTSGRRRVLVLGDSVAWCWGVEHADCFTEQLEAALRDTDVINAGVPAYSTAQELLLYEREGRRYRPDVVILVFVPNDLDDNLDGRGPRFRIADGNLVAPTAPAPRRKSPLQEWLQRSRLFAQLDYWTTLGKHLRKDGGERTAARPALQVASEGGTSAPAYPLRTEQAWALTEALLARILREVRGDGARFAMVLEEAPDPLVARLRRFCATENVPCLELGRRLAAAAERGERVRLDGDPHIAAAGQRVVADAMLSFLEREGLLPIDP